MRIGSIGAIGLIGGKKEEEDDEIYSNLMRMRLILQLWFGKTVELLWLGTWGAALQYLLDAGESYLQYCCQGCRNARGDGRPANNSLRLGTWGSGLWALGFSFGKGAEAFEGIDEGIDVDRNPKVRGFEWRCEWGSG